MKTLSIIVLFIALSQVQCSGQQSSKSWEDLNYAGDSLVSHMLDIHLPVVGEQPYPVVIIVYGSAFFGDNLKKEAFKTLGEPLLKSGFAVVAVNHRSSRDAIFPAQAHDIKASVRYIRANGPKFLMDTSFIGITGFSSGGHLSAFTGTSGSVTQLEGDIGNYTSYCSSVDAVVDWFGPTEFQSMDSCGSEMVHDAPDSPESILIGAPVQDRDDLCARANPISYIDSDDPPFLIFHGDDDPLVPHCQSEKLFAALQKAGVPSQLVLVPGARHGPGLFEKNYFRMMTDFFLEDYKNKW